MSMSIIEQVDFPSDTSSLARILVVGVGGGGGNAVQSMMESGLTGVDFVCANTDLQALNNNSAPLRIQLGEKLTRGLGAGSNPEVGHKAAEESIDTIKQALSGAQMVFITAGMGGGTGTGAAPIVAQVAKEAGALTVGVVTRPFSFEGQKRAGYAKAGIEELSKHVDCLITIPNDRIMSFAPKKTPLRDLMRKANEVLYFGVKGISDVITRPGYINLDFADVRTCMSTAGLALMGMGSGKGENRAEDAARNAIMSPLLEDVSLASAKAILYNITAPEDITGEEMELIGDKIRNEVPETAHIMAGVVFDESLEDELRVTVIATGIEPSLPRKSDTGGSSPFSSSKGLVRPETGVNRPAGGTMRKQVQQPQQVAPPINRQPPLPQEDPRFFQGYQQAPVAQPSNTNYQWQDTSQPQQYGQQTESMPYRSAADEGFYTEEEHDVPAFLRRQRLN